MKPSSPCSVRTWQAVTRCIPSITRYFDSLSSGSRSTTCMHLWGNSPCLLKERVSLKTSSMRTALMLLPGIHEATAIAMGWLCFAKQRIASLPVFHCGCWARERLVPFLFCLLWLAMVDFQQKKICDHCSTFDLSPVFGCQKRKKNASIEGTNSNKKIWR